MSYLWTCSVHIIRNWDDLNAIRPALSIWAHFRSEELQKLPCPGHTQTSNRRLSVGGGGGRDLGIGEVLNLLR